MPPAHRLEEAATTAEPHRPSPNAGRRPETWTDPWAELSRRPHIVAGVVELPKAVEGVYWPRGGRAAILLSSRLGRRDRRAVLAHELVHDERGGGCHVTGMPESWLPVVEREERRVDDLAAAHLVPPSSLSELVRRCATLEQPVTTELVAEEFDVPSHVAARALRALRRGPGPATPATVSNRADRASQAHAASHAPP